MSAALRIVLALWELICNTVHMSSICDSPGEVEGSDWQRYLDWIKSDQKDKSGTRPDSGNDEYEASSVRQIGNEDLGAAIFPDVFS